MSLHNYFFSLCQKLHIKIQIFILLSKILPPSSLLKFPTLLKFCYPEDEKCSQNYGLPKRIFCASVTSPRMGAGPRWRCSADSVGLLHESLLWETGDHLQSQVPKHSSSSFPHSIDFHTHTSCEGRTKHRRFPPISWYRVILNPLPNPSDIFHLCYFLSSPVQATNSKRQAKQPLSVKSQAPLRCSTV